LTVAVYKSGRYLEVELSKPFQFIQNLLSAALEVVEESGQLVSLTLRFRLQDGRIEVAKQAVEVLPLSLKTVNRITG